MTRLVLPGLLLARARHAGPRWFLVAVGLGLAAALSVVAQAVTAVTADAAMRRAVEALPAGERSVIVSFNGIPAPAEVARLDAIVAGQLPRLAEQEPRRQLLFRPIAAPGGDTFVLGAADRLEDAVRLTGGRLPAACDPRRCEVLHVRLPGARAVPPLDPALGLVVVGTAVRTDPLVLSGTFSPQAGAPLLVANGVRRAAALTALESFGRTYGWVSQLDLDRVRALGVEGWVRTGVDVTDVLWRDGKGLVLTTPDDLLRREDARARVSAQRFAVLGGAAAVLLLGTAVVGGAALRRDHETFLAALRRRGAGRRRIALMVAGEVGAAGLAGAVLGLASGAAAAAALAAAQGLPAVPTATAALLAALGPTAVLTAASVVLLALTLVAPAAPGGRAPSIVWRGLEAGVLGCAAVALLLAARGGVTAAAAAQGDPLLAALPVLVLVAAALALARLWPSAARLGQQVLPRRAVAARLGVSAAGGRPLRPAATAALVTAAVAAASFAGAYRATLDRGAEDQAAFAVPRDARLTVGRSLERPLDVAPPGSLTRALPGAAVDPVLRATASLRVGAQQAEPVELIGVDPAALTRVARWDAVTGGPHPAEVARAVDVPAVARGVALPPGRTLRVATPGSRVALAVTAYVRAPDGRERGVPLSVVRAGDPGEEILRGDLPDLAGPDGAALPLWLTAIELRLPIDEATRRQHALGEADRDLAAPTGRLALGGVRVDGVGVPDPWTGWEARGLRVAATGGSAVLDYALTQGALLLDARPRGPGSGSALPVVTDPQTAAAARGGRLPLVLRDSPLDVRVVGTVPRFPTATGRFAVVDLDALARLTGRSTPLAGQPGELWVGAGSGGPAALARVLSAPPYDGLGVGLRAATQERLRTDPVARGAADLLAAGALVLLLVAGAALVLLVVADRSDDAGQVYAWEADGVPPSTLRASLWWRAVAVVAPAVPAGVAAGVLLSAVTARLVAVTATAGTPRPPLQGAAGAAWVAGAVGIGLALALAVTGLVAARSLREALPVRGRGVYR